jgi:hypothetical protein
LSVTSNALGSGFDQADTPFGDAIPFFTPLEITAPREAFLDDIKYTRLFRSQCDGIWVTTRDKNDWSFTSLSIESATGRSRHRPATYSLTSLP